MRSSVRSVRNTSILSRDKCLLNKMSLFLSFALLFLSGTLAFTLGSTLKPFHDMDTEEALKYLYEKLSSLENREASDVLQRMKGEIKDELTSKLTEIEVKHNALEERISKEKESFDELSDRLLKEKNERLSMDNHILLEVHQLQRRALETVEKINALKNEITSASEVGRNRTDMLEVKINEAKVLAHSCLSSQRDTEEAVRRNMSTSDEILKILTNHTSEISSINTPIRVQTGCNPPCQNGGKCVGNNSCICTLSFSGDRCQNDYPQCDPDLRAVGTKESGTVGRISNSTPAWTWVAAVYWEEEDDLYPGFACGGSIIHRYFILATAWCMYHMDIHDWKIHNASELTVRLGMTDTRDPTHVQVYNVRTIHVHPLYRREHVHDYNIALLELNKPIDYNLYIRPVCLPPKETGKDNQFYKPHSSAHLIGWNGDIRLDTYILEETIHVIEAPDICNKRLKDLYKRNFTDRIFCALNENKPSCCGGGAMQSHPNEEGTRVWTQVGIHDERIWHNLTKTHVFFTHLQKVMPWVDKTIKDALKK